MPAQARSLTVAVRKWSRALWLVRSPDGAIPNREGAGLRS